MASNNTGMVGSTLNSAPSGNALYPSNQLAGRHHGTSAWTGSHGGHDKNGHFSRATGSGHSCPWHGGGKYANKLPTYETPEKSLSCIWDCSEKSLRVGRATGSSAHAGSKFQENTHSNSCNHLPIWF